MAACMVKGRHIIESAARLLLMPGKQSDPNPAKQGPYAKISRNGKISDPIPLKGNPTLDP
jgi:hypothetical protein